jgi:hypothetical protein
LIRNVIVERNLNCVSDVFHSALQQCPIIMRPSDHHLSIFVPEYIPILWLIVFSDFLHAHMLMHLYIYILIREKQEVNQNL